ncbi:MAG: response regulator transcription factor [Fibrobacter sp.]|jgi:two-component system response regulator RegX3|nr:response regulator transcription factor [Fibrobacter sp.]
MTQNTSSTNILIIEDEIAIAEGLVDLCELNGYRVKHVIDGESGLAEALSGQYGLVLLDLMLPGMDGFTVCDKIREKDKSLPIIILSAKNSDDDIINGLKFGADDYVPKPFSVPMLLARIEAVLRRSRQTMENEGKLVAGNLRVNFREYTGVRGTEELAFTRKEIEILEYLWNNRDHAIPRSELLRKVWGYENAESVDTRTVDIHITKLRKKIEDDPAHPKLLVTFRGEGYQMRSAPECEKSV